MSRTNQRPIEDYGFLSDTQSGALVSRQGSIDWLCLPRFDSGACFAALLGTTENGRWQLRPRGRVKRCTRRYRPDTLILETEFETSDGVVRLIDFMPPRGENPDVVRIVEGVRGRVPMCMELCIRFDYGQLIPWVRSRHDGLIAIGGPNALILRTPVKTRGRGLITVAEFSATKGTRTPFVLTWYASHLESPRRIHPERALRETERYWRKWTNACEHKGEWRDDVVRSLITLKGLTYAPTGGIVAALTTSLPETLQGSRNWDYRYCWLRDATFTLFALMGAGYIEEAAAWREWLLRAVAGSPSQMQIMYGVRGERRLDEVTLPWLSGYQRSRPVRVGNGAWNQRQIDVFGEVLDSTFQGRRAGLRIGEADWRVQNALLEFLESNWRKPDEGIWEVRTGARHFTHSKVMAWVAFDRAEQLVRRYRLSANGNLPRWRKLRDQIHRQICEKGFNRKLGSFTQSYGSTELDAALLQIPLVGFLPATDPRVRGTIDAIQKGLMRDGFLLRYRRHKGKTAGLSPTEGAFLPCTFWLANCLHLMGRHGEARRLFLRLLAIRNDLGLLAEEYHPQKRRQLGNFPQAFTHVALVNTAQILGEQGGATAERRTE